MKKTAREKLEVDNDLPKIKKPLPTGAEEKWLSPTQQNSMPLKG